MSATEQEIKAAQAEGARKEFEIHQATEQGALEIKEICNEREALLNRLRKLDKRQQELCGFQPEVMGLQSQISSKY